MNLKLLLRLVFLSLTVRGFCAESALDNHFKDYLFGKRLMRIGIAENCNEISVTSTANFSLLDATNTDLILNFPSLKICRIKLNLQNNTSKIPQLGIYANSEAKTCDNSIKVMPVDGNGVVMIQIGNSKTLRKYRGYLEIIVSKSGKLTIINTLKLDEYLCGVLPLEIGPKSPPEAIAAAAIAARSYTLANLGKHSTEFDLCSTLHCQLYRGLSVEEPVTKAKVAATAGKIMLYQGKPIIAAYHTTCGGLTENCENAWNLKPREYLESILDLSVNFNADLSDEKTLIAFLDRPEPSFCKSGENFRWKKTYKLQEIEKIFAQTLPAILNQSQLNIGNIQKLNILKRSRAGRVQTLEIKTDNGTYQVQKEQIRWLFGSGSLGTGLPSTLFIVKTEEEEGKPKEFTLIGAGWGHGVGMCVSGARGMAKAGYKYEEILKHYYRGAEIYEVNKEEAESQKTKD